jgi:4a-hydroxytetrahydrobiopterin dehydratase
MNPGREEQDEAQDSKRQHGPAPTLHIREGERDVLRRGGYPVIIELMKKRLAGWQFLERLQGDAAHRAGRSLGSIEHLPAEGARDDRHLARIAQRHARSHEWLDKARPPKVPRARDPLSPPGPTGTLVPMSRPTPMDVRDVDAWLTQHEGWAREGALAIAREYKFPDFSSALAFVVRVGCLAEKKDHHPDIELGWGKARLRWSTHDAGGITRLDIELAAASDALLS